LLYYVDGDFMSRKHVTRGMITLHPAGIPHGPQPGLAEKSIGAKETKELAVMVDTFRPLQLTTTALEIENEGYVMSWAE
jgi:homogentisate 1,2-dioxygenase